MPFSTEDMQLGYPPKGRFLFLKKLVGRLIWPFLGHQIDVNTALVNELERLHREQGEFTSRIEGQQLIAQQLTEARFAELASGIKARGDELALLNAQHETVNAAVLRHEEPLHRYEDALAEHNMVLNEIQRHIEGVAERIELVQRQSFARYHEGAGTLRRDIAEVSQELIVLREQVSSGLGMRVEEMISELQSDYSSSFHGLRSDVGAEIDELRTRLGRKSDDVREQLNELVIRMTQVDLKIGSNAQDMARDAVGISEATHSGVVLAASEAFAGTQADLRRRGRRYLGVFAKKPAEGPIVDLACGRGAWLEELRDLGMEAYGLTTSPRDLEEGRGAGLDVRKEGAFTHLRSVQAQTLGGVVASGLAEQLDLDALVELLELAVVALNPGGVLMLEAQNVRNIAVGSSGLYRNPLARRAVHPDLLAFLFGAVGLRDIELRYDDDGGRQLLGTPTPEGKPWASDLIPLIALVNEQLLGPSHYAVIGHRR